MPDDLTLIPQLVVPVEPEFYTVITASEGMNKQYQSINDTGFQRFELTFKALSSANFQTLYNHFYSCHGPYDWFRWDSIPDYIDLYTSNSNVTLENVGSNLVSNSGFNSDTTGWTNTNSTIASIAGGQSGNCLEITRVSDDYQECYQAIGLTKGELYKFTAYVKSGTSGDEAFIISTCSANGYERETGTSSSSWTEYSVTFRALVSGSCNMILRKNTATAGTMLFDTITIYNVKQVMDARWIAGTFKPVPLGNSKWQVRVTLELSLQSYLLFQGDHVTFGGDDAHW